MRNFSGVIDRNRFMGDQQERIGKCEKKRMMNRIIVNSMTEIGKISEVKIPSPGPLSAQPSYIMR